MLAACEDLVLVNVPQNIACYDMFLDFAADASNGEMTVVSWLCTFLPSLMTPKWQKLASLAQEICTL